MTLKDPDLWTRLETDPIRLSSGRTLADLVAERSGFGRRKVAVAIREYRRFLYLAATAGETVVPSPLVDWIWHRHLEDTRAYVEDFCPRVFGRLIHHSPFRARAAADPLYDRTRALLEAAFGSAHPRIWPERRMLAAGGWVGFWAAAAVLGAALLVANGLWQAAVPVAAAGLAAVVWWQVRRPWAGRSGAGSGSGAGGCSGDSGDGGCGGD